MRAYKSIWKQVKPSKAYERVWKCIKASKVFFGHLFHITQKLSFFLEFWGFFLEFWVFFLGFLLISLSLKFCFFKHIIAAFVHISSNIFLLQYPMHFGGVLRRLEPQWSDHQIQIFRLMLMLFQKQWSMQRLKFCHKICYARYTLFTKEEISTCVLLKREGMDPILLPMHRKILLAHSFQSRSLNTKHFSLCITSWFS